MQDKIKLLFILPSYRYGGTMTSFKNLLPLLDTGKYDIDITAITDEGDSKDYLRQFATILGDGNNVSPTSKNYLLTAFSSISLLMKRIIARFGMDIAPIMLSIMARRLDCSKYDFVIGYQEGYATYMASKTKSKCRIAWIHSMYSRLKGLESKKMLEAYNGVEKIVCVSKTAANDFKKFEPNLSDKIYTVYNALDPAFIRCAAKDNSPITEDSATHIVSVGRIDPVKRFSSIPLILHELREHGLNIVWHIIGGNAVASEYERLCSEIKKYELEDFVILEGLQENPIKFIKACKLLVCLSSSETFNYTLAEARSVGVPVITTDFPAAKEFVDHGVNGLISPIERMCETIEEICKNGALYDQLKLNIKNYQYNNDMIVQQIESLIK